MLEINRKCKLCQRFFKRPAADRVPANYCTACWEEECGDMALDAQEPGVSPAARKLSQQIMADRMAAEADMYKKRYIPPADREAAEAAAKACARQARRDDLADRQDSDHLRGVRKMMGTDPGAHYRWEIRRRITDEDIARGYVAVKVDPYRIAKVAGVGGGPHEHATKKLLRGEAKGHEARELIREVRCCLDRWEEMLDEDEEEARCR